MPREDWRELEAERMRRRAAADAARNDGPRDFGQADYSQDYAYDRQRRAGYRVEADLPPAREDYGQADYSTDYVYDAQTGHARRRDLDDDLSQGRRDIDQPRSWMTRAGEFLGGARGRVDDDRRPRRAGTSDRVLWAVIVERLEDAPRLDLRDLEVIVEGGEVTLNGTVRRKDDKRRIEDIADIDGVGHVQNNLRIRDRGWF